MSIYAVEPPGADPEYIMRWSVREVKCSWSEVRTRHLVGYIPLTQDGRTSSPIQSFDRETMQIKTRSGRIYQLHGPPGGNSDAEYIWDFYVRTNNATDEIDVTDQYAP